MCFGYNLVTQLFFTVMLLGMDRYNFNMSEKFSLQTDCPRKFVINLRNKNIINVLKPRCNLNWMCFMLSGQAIDSPIER